MVSVCKIVERLVLLVNNSYTCFMCTTSDILDIFGGLALLFQPGMDQFCSFDSRLRMKLRYVKLLAMYHDFSQQSC